MRWDGWHEVPSASEHGFDDRLNAVLHQAGFNREVEVTVTSDDGALSTGC
jgi:hypothetical protein